MLAHGGKRIGLEAGSKPELLAVLALASGSSGLVVCNGYKDAGYIRLALIGRRLGLRVYIIIEKPGELELVLREARALGIEPLLGVRVRLASIAGGTWQNSGGEKAKFGLSAAQTLNAIEQLRAADMLTNLRMLHCHMGSQIANIRDIQKGIRELSRYYIELRTLNAPIDTINVGGGLGVDYEGSRSRSPCSMNYNVQEYANNIVHTLGEACNGHGLPHPAIVSESGRALSAHHALLITHVIDHEKSVCPDPVEPPPASAPPLMRSMWETFTELDQGGDGRSLQEVYHDVMHWMSEAQEMYIHGVLNLDQRAVIERLYFAICTALRRRLNPGVRAQRVLIDELNTTLAGKFFLNFSLFQSLPDVWGIGQVFPVVPLQRLDEAPSQRIVIEDITCDSDGRIDRYVEFDGLEPSLAVHDLQQDEPYLLGIFMVGAYQEILGDMHNLFGDTDAVNVEPDAEGGYRLGRIQQGDTVAGVLRYVNFDPAQLRGAYRQMVASQGLSGAEQECYLRELLAGLEGYTYLEG